MTKGQKLTKEERDIEAARKRGEYISITSGKEFNEIAAAIEARKKNASITIRVNKNDITLIKEKAKKLGVKYQTFISEILHRIAHETDSN